MGIPWPIFFVRVATSIPKPCPRPLWASGDFSVAATLTHASEPGGVESPGFDLQKRRARLSLHLVAREAVRTSTLFGLQAGLDP